MSNQLSAARQSCRLFVLAAILSSTLLPAPATCQEVSKEVEAKAVALLNLVAPFRLADLEALKKANPQDYKQRVANYADRMRQLEELQQIDPERYKLRLDEMTLEQKSIYLGEQYRKEKSAEERARLKTELAALLDHLFDIRGKNKATEIRNLEAEIARLKEALAERQRSKKEIVRARLDELLGEKTIPEW